MNAKSTTVRRDVVTNALALFSVTAFWALPFSPFIAMAAVHRTKTTTGWARRVSVAAAVLCSIYTLALGAALYWLTFLTLTGRINS